MTDTKEQAAEKFDVDSLTLGEVDQIETLSGFAIDLLKDRNTPKGKLLAAIAFVIKHRTNPKYTFPMALTLPMSDVLELIGDDDETPAETPEDLARRVIDATRAAGSKADVESILEDVFRVEIVVPEEEAPEA